MCLCVLCTHNQNFVCTCLYLFVLVCVYLLEVAKRQLSIKWFVSIFNVLLVDEINLCN